MDLISTIEGSMMEGFFPKGWDLKKIDECAGQDPASVSERQEWWHEGFSPVACETLEEFNVKMGHEISVQIRKSRGEGKEVIFILPVGPMGMYEWAVYFLKEWGVACGHVYGFNMDEWSDRDGNTLPPDNPGAFQYAMEEALYGPLGELSVPPEQRNFATKENLPAYPEKIAALREKGARMVLVHGIGRVCHIAFWEPHFAGEYESVDQWKEATHRLGAKLHPLTIEQNAITSFKSRTTLVPAFANTIGPGIFLKADYVIGGCDGALSRGMQWQGMSLWMTLRYGPDPWVPSSFMPTMPGKLFFLKELAGPLTPECN
jgi:glucosamine-6-phosphate deaminase